MAYYLALHFFRTAFISLEQVPNADGKSLDDLITFQYALASLIACSVIITFQLRNIDGVNIQRTIILGYAIGFGIMLATNLTLHLNDVIDAISATIGTGIIVILSFYSFFNLKFNATNEA